MGLANGAPHLPTLLHALLPSEIERLRNLGPTSARWLHGIGVHTLTELREMGAVRAFWRADLRAELDTPWDARELREEET